MESDESLREAAFRLVYLWSAIFIKECVTPDEGEEGDEGGVNG